MIKIKTIRIKRFRSIMDMTLNIDNNNNLISICGENNTGKTNTLRALNIFFNEKLYDATKDAPYHKFKITRGSAVYPEITIDFLTSNDDVYRIKKKYDRTTVSQISGLKLRKAGIRVKNENMLEKEVKSFLQEIYFFYIESINISFPELINNLIDDIYDFEYANTQFRGLKGDLKKSFEKYVNGLLEILNKLSAEIKPLFKEYKNNWGVEFDISTDVKKFRDLISDDIVFYINDSSNKKIEGKGSGLQRLAYILLHFRIISKIKKSVIFLIDEPDVFLHQGLEKKLYDDLQSISTKCQVFITTHSPIFIDTYTLNNVFLLDLEIEEGKLSKRTKDTYSILRTKLVDIENHIGAKKIKGYLGIEDNDYDMLDNYNILVEGESDKVYLSELCLYFKLPVPKIIPVNGANNIEKYIEFYNSFYKNQTNKKPAVLILLDNDNKGREVYVNLTKKINKNLFSNLDIESRFVPTFQGKLPNLTNINKLNSDLQIEDFIYPKVFCELVNKLLKNAGFKPIKGSDICKKIEQPAHSNRGILYLVENEKNNVNPEDGDRLNFVGSGKSAEGLKSGIANSFKIEGNIKLSKIIEIESQKFPFVKSFLEEITKFQ